MRTINTKLEIDYEMLGIPAKTKGDFGWSSMEIGVQTGMVYTDDA